MKTIQVPGYGNVQFPDTMSDDDVAQAIDRDILPQLQSGALKPQTTIGGNLREAAKGIIPGATESVLGGAEGIAGLGEWAMGIPRGQGYVTRNLRRWIGDVEEEFKPEPGYETSTGRQIGTALGSIAGIAGTGGLGGLMARGVGLAGRAATAAQYAPVAATAIGSGAYEARKRLEEFQKQNPEAEVSETKQFLAEMMGLPAGALDIIPYAKLRNVFLRAKTDDAFRLGLLPSAGRMFKMALVEGTQEVAQDIIQDLSAKAIYNPKQEIGGNALQTFLTTGAASALFQAGMEAALPFRVKARIRELDEQRKAAIAEVLKQDAGNAEAAKKVDEQYAALGQQLLLPYFPSVLALPGKGTQLGEGFVATEAQPDPIPSTPILDIGPRPQEDPEAFADRLVLEAGQDFVPGRWYLQKIIDNDQTRYSIVGPRNVPLARPFDTWNSAMRVFKRINTISKEREIQETYGKAADAMAGQRTANLLEAARLATTPTIFTPDEMGPELYGQVNSRRAEQGLPNLPSYTPDQLADAGIPINDLRALREKINPTPRDERVVPNDIRALADQKNIDTEHPNFREYSRRVTGVADFERMGQEELVALKRSMDKLPRLDVKTGVPLAPRLDFTDQHYDQALSYAFRKDKLDANTIGDGLGLKRDSQRRLTPKSLKVARDMLEKMVDRGDAQPVVPFNRRTGAGDADVSRAGEPVPNAPFDQKAQSFGPRHKAEYQLFRRWVPREELPEGRTEYAITGKPVTGQDRSAWVVYEQRVSEHGELLGQVPVATFDTQEQATKYVADQNRIVNERPTIEGKPATGILIQTPGLYEKERAAWAKELKKPLPWKAKDADVQRNKEKLATKARRYFDSVGLSDVGVKVADDLTQGEGEYFMRVVKVALMDEAVAAEILDHETIHALRDLGLFRDEEWFALVKKAETTVDPKSGETFFKTQEAARLNHPKTAAEFTALQQKDQEAFRDGVAEEAVAEMYRAWRKDPKPFAGQVGGLLNRIKVFFARLKSFLNNEKIADANQVMERIASGEVGGRARNQPQGIESVPLETRERAGIGRQRKFALSPSKRFALAAEETGSSVDGFGKWFGDSVTVMSDGKPQKFFHGTLSDWTDIKPGSEESYLLDRMLGTHFSPDPAVASRFAMGLYRPPPFIGGEAERPQWLGGNVKPAYIASKNPYQVAQPKRDGVVMTDQVAIATDMFARYLRDRPHVFHEAYGQYFRDQPSALHTSEYVDNPERSMDAFNRLRANLPLQREDFPTGHVDETFFFKDDFLREFVYDYGVPGSIRLRLGHDIIRHYRKELESEGHDALIYSNTAPEEIAPLTDTETYQGRRGDRVSREAWIVWKPEIVKSIFNPMTPQTRAKFAIHYRDIGATSLKRAEAVRAFVSGQPDLSMSAMKWSDLISDNMPDSRPRPETYEKPEIAGLAGWQEEPTKQSAAMSPLTSLIMSAGPDEVLSRIDVLDIIDQSIKEEKSDSAVNADLARLRSSYDPSKKYAIHDPITQGAIDKLTAPRQPLAHTAIHAVTNPTQTFRGWRQRFREAWVGARAQTVNMYEALGYQEEQLRKQGKLSDAELMADVSASKAALMSDRTQFLLSEAMRSGGIVWKRKPGGQPWEGEALVVKTGVDGQKLDGLIKILELVGKKGLWREFQLYAAARRSARLITETNAKGKSREQLFTPQEIQAGLALGTKFPEFAQVFEQYQRWNEMLVNFMTDTGVLSPELRDIWVNSWDYTPFYRQFDGEQMEGPRVFNSMTGVKIPPKLKGGQDKLGEFTENIIHNARAAIGAGMKNIAAKRAIRDGIALGNATALKHPTKRSVTIREGGKDKHYEIDDHLLHEALEGLDSPNPIVWGIFKKPAQILRGVVTKDPAFMLANLIRDSLSSWVTAAQSPLPILGTLNGMAQELRGSTSSQALRSRGVTGNTDFSSDIEWAGKHLRSQYNKNPATKAWDVLERITEGSDAATRIAVYDSVLKKTGNEAEAAYQALEIMNFTRHGRHHWMRLLSALVPFFNARIQGIDVLLRAGFGPKFGYTGRTDTGPMMRKFWTRAMFMMGMALAYYQMIQDNDDWKNATPEERDNYWLIPAGSTTFRIPIPFEVGVLFKVIPERLAAAMDKTDNWRDFGQSMARAVSGTLGMNPIPQAAKPILEAATNYSFFRGRPVEGQAMSELIPSERASSGTSQLARILGKTFDYSPTKIDYLINGYIPGIASWGLFAVDEAMQAARDTPDRPERRTSELPFFRRFVQAEIPQGSVALFYDIRDKAREVARTVSLLNRSGRYEEARELMTDERALFTAARPLEALARNMGDLRAMRKRIESSRDMTPAEKRERIDEIKRMENRLASIGREMRSRVFQ